MEDRKFYRFYRDTREGGREEKVGLDMKSSRNKEKKYVFIALKLLCSLISFSMSQLPSSSVPTQVSWDSTTIKHIRKMKKY